MTIQKTIIKAATILLIILLIMIAYMLYNAKNNTQFPPEIAECPDYWKVNGIENCENVKDLGTCPGVHDFSGAEWQGKTGLKKKYDWARTCGVVWDGITNNTLFTN